MKLPIIGILSGVALATLGISSAAQAAILLPSLTPGSQYRLVFVTSGTKNATSTSIADYNQFVNNAAQASTNLNTALTTAGFTPSTINWKAIGSTSQTVNAKVNTATNTNDLSYPIYRLDGARVATGNADLWDGSIGSSISFNEIGNAISSSVVWTGTGSAGNGFANQLGTTLVLYGTSSQVGTTWVSSGGTYNSSTSASRFYGISSVLTVPTPTTATTPEPSSLLSFITLGGLILGGAVRGVRK